MKASYQPKKKRFPPRPIRKTPFHQTRRVFTTLFLSLLLFILLILLILVSPRFLGQAYLAPTGEKIDVYLEDDTLFINASLGSKKTNAVYLELTADDFDFCEDIEDINSSIENLLWDNFYTLSCEDETLVFSDATLDESDYQGGRFDILELSLEDIPDEHFHLEILALDIYDASTGQDIFPEEREYTFSVKGEETCLSEWHCSDWSLCNASGFQIKTCSDFADCLPDYNRTQRCLCAPSWVCSAWSECFNNYQTRQCSDEHQCQNFSSQPALKKACTAPEPSPAPGRIYTEPPEPYIPKAPKLEAPQPTFWDKYGLWLLIPSSALVLILIVLILVLHFRHPSAAGATNLDELRDWIKLELQSGLSPVDIRNTLRQQTDWSPSEIDQAFREVRG